MSTARARAFASSLLLTALLTTAADAAPGEPFYAGKQIRLIVSTEAGGAYDTYARLVAQVLKDHIPGNPSIIVQNMPGASALKAANYIATLAPRDGTVIAGTHSSIITAALTSPGAASFNPTTFSFIGSATSDPYLGYVWHTSPIMRLEDARNTDVVMGGVSVGSAGVDLAILAREMFGLKLKIVTGYKSSNEIKLAMERGEVEGTFANAWSSIRGAEPEWLTSGKVRIIVQHGFRKHPALPEVPSIFEFATSEADRQALVFMLARQEAAKPYFAPPQVPIAQLTVLRRAFDEMVRDPKFLDLASKAAVTVDQPMTGEEVAALVASVAQTPAAVIARVNRMLMDKK
jgi:tripartite-type tricarboxylate transporter receptor subunit TctC